MAAEEPTAGSQSGKADGDWRSWTATPACPEVPGQATAEEYRAAEDAHDRLVDERIRGIEGMLPGLAGGDVAAARHVLCRLYCIRRGPGFDELAWRHGTEAVKLYPSNGETWLALGRLHYYAARRIRACGLDAKEIDDGLGGVTPLTGNRSGRARIRSKAMERQARSSMRCFLEAIRWCEKGMQHAWRYRKAVALRNEAEKRLAKSVKREPRLIQPPPPSGYETLLTMGNSGIV